jgi:hypothetical protein
MSDAEIEEMENYIKSHRRGRHINVVYRFPFKKIFCQYCGTVVPQDIGDYGYVIKQLPELFCYKCGRIHSQKRINFIEICSDKSKIGKKKTFWDILPIVLISISLVVLIIAYITKNGI